MLDDSPVRQLPEGVSVVDPSEKVMLIEAGSPCGTQPGDLSGVVPAVREAAQGPDVADVVAEERPPLVACAGPHEREHDGFARPGVVSTVKVEEAGEPGFIACVDRDGHEVAPGAPSGGRQMLAKVVEVLPEILEGPDPGRP